MALKKWDLISKKDVSPDSWFPIEMRRYRLPDGRVVDFSVTTIADVSMVVPVTAEGKIVMVRQFKPGIGDIILEFPAGRMHAGNDDFRELARSELEEETGIRVSTEQLEPYGMLAGFTTKGSEKVYLFLVKNCVFNAQQKLDETEDIEVVTYAASEIDEKIASGEIYSGQSIAAWFLAKRKFPGLLDWLNEK